MDAQTITAFAAVGGVIVSIGLLTWQLHQQSLLQRKKVEEEYIRLAHRALYAPEDAVREYVYVLDDYRRMYGIAAGEKIPEFTPAIAAATNHLREAILTNATQLALLIDLAEAVKRKTSTSEYDSLLAALQTFDNAALALGGLVAPALLGQLRSDGVSDNDLFAAARAAREVACTVLADRIVEIYKLGAPEELFIS